MARCRARVAALGFIFICALPAGAVILADSVSVSGDSISRAFDANTSSCTYSDQVSRNWATGDDHGSSFCSAGGDGTFSHAERLECNKGGDVTIFNDAMSGATMLGDFATQATNIKQHLSSAPSPRYVLVFMGHNDACTGTVDKTGNSCGGDRDPNNYCRTSNVDPGLRSSNHACSEPSIWTSSPRQARRGRGGWLRRRRCARGTQRPAAVIHPRSVSTEKARPCCSVSF